VKAEDLMTKALQAAASAKVLIPATRMVHATAPTTPYSMLLAPPFARNQRVCSHLKNSPQIIK
jgi:hypothetical protein